MASNFLDDLCNLSTSADESQISALVGSLESQLSSSNVSANVQAFPAASSLVDSNHSTSSTTCAAAAAPAATGELLAGNGNSHATTTTCAPPASATPSTVSSTTTSPAPASVATSQIQLPNNNSTAHSSMLPNGNPTAGVINVQQFVGTSVNLPNGTVAGMTATTMALPGSLVIQQQPKIATVMAPTQPAAMVIPAKGPAGQTVHQGTVLNTNGATPTATTVINPSQVLRPQVVQQHQQQQGQQVVMNSAGGLLPAGVQVVNMNAMRPTQNIQNMAAINAANANRGMAPRVVLAPNQVVGARPGQMGITLQALQGFQAAGAQGHLLVKTENGQYQLLRVGPGPVAGTTVGSPVVASNIPPLQNVAAVAQQQQPNAQSSLPGGAVPNVNQQVAGATYRLQVPTNSTLQTVPSTVASPAVVTTAAPPASNQAASGNSGQMTPDTAKVKCKNFLSTLLRLASEQPESVATNVQSLIQGLVDAKVEPEEFTTKLQRELNSSPQPCLIPFLKKSLPYLRQSLATRELTIEGIRPPVMASVGAVAGTISHQQPSVINRVNAGPTQVQTVRPMGAGTPVRVMTPNAIGASPAGMVTPSPRPPRPTAANKATPKAKAAQQTLKGNAAAAARITEASALAATSAGDLSTQPIQFTISLPPVGGAASTTTGSAPIVSVLSSTSATASTTGTSASTAFKTAAGASSASVGAAIKGALASGKDMSKDKKAFGFSSSSSLVGLSGDNDINDVAAMGGVNLAEESQRILGSTEMIGTQIRSCKDENFLFTAPLQRRIQQIAAKHGLTDTSVEVVSLISHATQERLKTILEKLAVIAEHRMEVVKTDSRYEVQQDVKGQLKFLEELDKLERRRHSEIQREMLLKAAKSRSKAEDPEQAKLKAKAKEMQRAEMEELRQREANMTALQAIGIRKKPKLDLPGSSGSFNQVPLRPRVKRVNLRDLLFLLKEEKGTVRSRSLLYKAYLK